MKNRLKVLFKLLNEIHHEEVNGVLRYMTEDHEKELETLLSTFLDRHKFIHEFGDGVSDWMYQNDPSDTMGLLGERMDGETGWTFNGTDYISRDEYFRLKVESLNNGDRWDWDTYVPEEFRHLLK
jgi:hypothetical protein